MSIDAFKTMSLKGVKQIYLACKQVRVKDAISKQLLDFRALLIKHYWNRENKLPDGAPYTV